VNTTIICIGNRLVPEDQAGLLVYDLLRQKSLPHGVDLVEGGLAGLDLLPLLERGGRVIFADQVRGFAEADSIVILRGEDILVEGTAVHFDHQAGLPYLLAVLPQVCEGEMAEEVALVGLEGQCSPATIERAAALCIAMVEGGVTCSG
jgi:hydrogenase maturation protease